MNSPTHVVNLFHRLARIPTAPFREQWMLAELDRILAEIPGVRTVTDDFGNRIAILGRLPDGLDPALSEPTPFAYPLYVAHLDHPGFTFPEPGGAVARPGHPMLFDAIFEGGVDDAFFPGAPVRLFHSPESPGIGGTVREASPRLPEVDHREVLIEAPAEAAGARLAVWDVPAFELRAPALPDGRPTEIAARVCDDLSAVAAILAAFHQVAALPPERPALIAAAFTRAEEAGFCGTLCLVESGKLEQLFPPEDDAVYVSVETSAERPHVAPGEGVVIRLGDRWSTFDGAVSDAFVGVARDRKIPARRALMDGGTCEATPFIRRGFRTAALCIPERNYHNMDRATGRIAPEIVSIADLEAEAALIAGIAEAFATTSDPLALAPARTLPLDRNLAKGRRLLRR